MDSGAHKLLESTIHRTLHASGFSRSSSQASLVLTDLLSRYLTLLASTCGKYAEHAGRRRFTSVDAVLALDELGVSVEELKEFGSSEGLELNRYAAVKSMRRVEDLAEFRGQLNDGLRGDTDDFIALHYAPLPPEEDSDSDEDADYDDDMEIDTEIGIKRPSSPFLTPSSPKRPRTLNWVPPPHIPDFLPPFPKPKEPETIPPSTTHSPIHGLPPLPDLPSNETVGTTVPTQDIAAAATSTAASDYLVPVPYSDSSLSSIPEWHLPTPPPRTTSSLSLSSQQRWPTPQTEPSLLSAYHHILTTNPPLNASANGGGGLGVGGGSHPGSRHKIAMALLNLIQTQPRWDVADTLWSNVSGNQPRVAPVGPTFPMALGSDSEKEKKERGEKDSKDSKDGKDKEGGGGKDKDVKFPTTMPRSVAVNEKLSVTVSQPGSRIPELSRHVLPPNIFARTSRLTHPPVLSRGSKQLMYGTGVPAPWNANLSPSTDPKDGAIGQGGSVGGGANPNGKGVPGVNGIIKGEQQPKSVLPDARLFATWDYEVRDYRAPIPGHLRKGRVASSGGGSGHGTTGGVGVVGHGGPGSLQLRGVGGRSASAKAG
ncbi:hypothetical protein L218DRAFT_962578 [Marasmius fiardii PR-910]|nr:hypothetical protein L218DRAFT_962578 [Marasmius fiardii PR-910]